MKASSRSLPGWLMWVFRVLGILMVAASAYFLYALVQGIRGVWMIKHGALGGNALSTAFLKIIYQQCGAVAIWAFGLLVPGLLLLRWSWKKTKSPPSLPLAQIEKPEPVVSVVPKAPRRSAPKHWQICNVLHVGAEAQQLWQFEQRGGSFNLNREETTAANQPLPAKLVGKTWRSLWQPKLNIAWLPPENVFLRVAQLPRADFNETLSMVELQLEKLSPLPVAQIVWSIQVLPASAGDLQTVVVTIVARSLVEEFLGRLEGEGYLADLLEVPLLDQLQTTAITGDGAWIYPDSVAGTNSALVAWWYGGTLQNLGLIHAPPGEERGAIVKEQLAQMAWAGELEGWLTPELRWHLVAGSATAAEWQPLLAHALDQPVEVIAPLSPTELAAATAQRSAQSKADVSLVPGEYALRYRQQFFDRLWMRGLAGVLGLYILGVLIYFGALGFLTFQTRAEEKKVADLGPTYTNALQLKGRFQVLQDRQDLKYAALDCWKTTAELLPESATLNAMDLKEGKKLTLRGTAPADQIREIQDFNGAVRKATKDGQPMFRNVTILDFRQDAGGSTISWSFSCELNRVEVQ